MRETHAFCVKIALGHRIPLVANKLHELLEVGVDCAPESSTPPKSAAGPAHSKTWRKILDEWQSRQRLDTSSPSRIVETKPPHSVYKLREIDLTKTSFEPSIQAFSTLAATPGRLLVPDRRQTLSRSVWGD